VAGADELGAYAVEKEGSSSSGMGVERSGVRHQHVLQISGHAGRAEGEKGGGSAQACHTVEGEREKEGGGVGSVARPWGRNGSGWCGQR
jgi:hypothetical protein